MLIPVEKAFRFDLRKLIRDLSFKFIFTFIFTNFVIGSFPIIKKQCIFSKINTYEIWEITLGSFCFSFQIISQDSSGNIDNVPLLMFSLKVWFIIIWCRTFKNLERILLLLFSKYFKTGKINSRPHLIPITPKISPILFENVIVPWIQVSLNPLT